MDQTKLKKQIKKFEEYLVVDRGLGPVTVQGYCRTINFALRKMRKFCPKYEHIKEHILWMHEKKYSYSHLVNTSIAPYLRRVYFTTIFFRLKTKKEVSKWAIARPCLKKGVPGFELVFKTLV